MKVGNQYIIPFKGLTAGDHYFNFGVKKEFFDENSELEISNGLVQIDLVLSKKTNFLALDFHFDGWVEVICDRCLELFKYPINFKSNLFVKFKESIEEPDENVIFLHPNEDVLDLNQYFFDTIALQLPIQKYHPTEADGKSKCSAGMLKIIRNHSLKESKNEKETIDPRWSKLKNLLNDGNKNE